MSKLRLIDATSLCYRAYFSLPHSREAGLRNPAGEPIGAVYGVTRMLMNFAKRIEEGDCVAAVFDAHRNGGSWRNAIDANYKMNRGPKNADLARQIPICREVAALLGFNPVKADGYEADDLIASYGRVAWNENTYVEVCSPDKDLLSMMGVGVDIFDPLKNNRMGGLVTVPDVLKKFGVYPHQMPSLLALAGDSADNIEGLPGIGLKTAASLLWNRATLEDVLRDAPTITPPRIASTLRAHADRARKSLALATLKTNVPLPVPISDLAYRGPDRDGLRAFFEKHAFQSLLTEYGMAA